MDTKPIVGVDLGGTYIKAVLVDPRGEILSEVSFETEASHGPNHVIERMRQAAAEVCERGRCSLGDVMGIGIGSPGPLSPDLGTVISSANLPGWQQVPLRELMTSVTGASVAMTNDANAATYGEFWRGAGQGAQHVCMLTLGTGVGGGVIVNGELLHGHFGNAGELGHMIVAPGETPCRCGQYGCLETVASSSYLCEKATEIASRGESAPLKSLIETKGSIDVPDIVECARQGDPASGQLWAAACMAVAVACVTLHHAFNPQYVILGGGMAAAGAELLEPVRREFTELTWKLADDRPEVRLAALGGTAGAVGAAGWFMHLRNRGVV